jgi:hypothetical protein
VKIGHHSRAELAEGGDERAEHEHLDLPVTVGGNGDVRYDLAL